MGRKRYPDATRLLITADCGGSNGARVRLWKRRAAEARRPDRPGHHRLLIIRPAPASGTASSTACSPSSPRTGAASRLLTHQVIVQLIAATTTATGLSVACQLDANSYDKGIKVSDPEMAALNIQPANFHGEWNYTISPRLPEQ